MRYRKGHFMLLLAGARSQREAPDAWKVEDVVVEDGVRWVSESGYTDLSRYHMNDGHAALLTLELLGEEAAKVGRESIRGEDIEKVRSKCVFTTHTPVPAGHDRFPMEFLTRAFPERQEFLDLNDASAAELL